MADRATRGRWQNSPLGEGRRLRLPLAFSLDKAEMDAVSMGVIPREMEDKWFIFFEDGRLYFHRSWTGLAVYEIRFEEEGGRHVARDVWAARYQAEPAPEEDQIRYHLDLLPRLLRWKFGVEVRRPVAS